MAQSTLDSSPDLAIWSKLAQAAGENAFNGLSQMVNQEIKVTAVGLEEVSMRDAASLIGKADDLVVAIYLTFSGSATGHIMLAFPSNIAFELVDMAMDIPSGSTHSLGEMEQSVLGEVGNVVAAFFLSAVADEAGLRLLPSPPAVGADMAAALISPMIAEVLQEEQSIFAIKLFLSTPEREFEGRFLVLPISNVKSDMPDS